MGGLSRRQFLARTAALAAALGVSVETLAPQLALAQTDPGEIPSTLLQTILYGPVTKGSYRTLTAGPGEPYIARYDVLGRTADPTRTSRRRSLLYLGHLSDLHVIDAQSPGRIEPMIVQDHSAWGSAFHPHDPLSPHTTAAMVQAFSDARYSPLTGVPMGAAIVTGDSADMHSHLELRWYIDLMDGLSVNPASSGSTYQGVQAWPEATWAYRPNDPSGGSFGDYGFPTLPALLDDAISHPATSPGLPAPWYAVYGNHDTLLLGTFNLSPTLHALAVGGRKAYTLEATASMALAGYAASGSAVTQLLDAFGLWLGRPGFKEVTANPGRYLFAQRDFMAEHFTTETQPGPIGHGFTQHNLDSGETWWTAQLSPFVRAIGLDTCNAVAGPDGALPDVQFQWLKAQLQQATTEGMLVVVLSHHNSLTLENDAQRPGDTTVLHHAEDVIDLLLAYPVAIAWLNGHTHLNQILAHPGANGGGFWEITTASCIDFPQQQQVLEIVDNRDGTLSIFTTVLDHASAAAPAGTGAARDLAARAREFAANDWAESPAMRRGSALDRNTELLLPAPFDLEKITDAALEAQRMTERARILAHEQKAAYSTDANIWGATHEAKTLEHLDVSLETVEPIMGVRFWDPSVEIAAEDVTVTFEAGRPVALNGVEFRDPVALVFEANRIGGRHGLGMSDQIENRIIEAKSRGIYEAPGMALLFIAYERLVNSILNEDTLATYHEQGRRLGRLMYEGRWLEPQSLMLRESIQKWVGSTITGSVTLRLRRGEDYTILDTTAVGMSYAPEKLSMERVGDAAFGPVDRIGQLTMRNLDIADSRARLEQYAAQGLIGGPTGALVGRLESGAADEIVEHAEPFSDAREALADATDAANESSAFDAGTD